jgi:solute carrier family 35, member F1/2
MSLNGNVSSSLSSLEHGDDVDDSAAFVTKRDKSNVLQVSSTYASLSFEAGRAIIAYVKDHWRVILFGQFLSFLLACAGAAQATLHFECSLSAPAFTNGIFYAAITFHLIPLYLKGKELREIKNSKKYSNGDVRETAQDQYTWFLGVIPLRGPYWGFALVGFLDVQANYLTVLSYRYTTLSSVSLFDSLAIPSAMLLSRILLGRRHSKLHFLGVFICMVGIVYNAFADYESEKTDEPVNISDEYPHKMVGDVVAVIGGILYGASDVFAELSVRNFGGPTEFLGMMGFFATIVSLIQAAILERHEISNFYFGVSSSNGKVCSRDTGFLLVLAYVFINTLSYTLTTWFLTFSEATFLNLSLLTGDLWSVVFMVFAEGIIPPTLFWAALFLIISGVLIYEMGPETHENTKSQYEIASQESEKNSDDKAGEIEML